MDQELRESLGEIKESILRVETKVERHADLIHGQDVRLVAASARAESAHARMDSHKADHVESAKLSRAKTAWWGAQWVLIIALGVRMAWDWLMKGRQ